MSKIKVSQKLSLIGKTKKQIACIKGLGLRRISDTKILETYNSFIFSGDILHISAAQLASFLIPSVSPKR